VLIVYQQIWLINWQAKSRNTIIFQFVLMKVQTLWIQRKCLFSSEGSTDFNVTGITVNGVTEIHNWRGYFATCVTALIDTSCIGTNLSVSQQTGHRL